MAFAPDGRLFVAERLTGRILVWRDERAMREWARIPIRLTGEEQGVLGIAVDPNFLVNRYVYVAVSNAHGRGKNGIFRLQEVNGAGVDLTPIGPATTASNVHNIGPLVFGGDGKLYVQSGDSIDPGQPIPPLAQSLESLRGKVLRMNTPEGTVPSDNPFPGSYIWSFGHRNAFGLAVHPVSAALYLAENGQWKQDELNVLIKGANYGWPRHEGTEELPDPTTEDPIWVWGPTISPTGACFYSGELYPASFRGALFVGDYNTGGVQALTLDASGQQVTNQTAFWDYPRFVYGVVNGPDGNVWVLRQAEDTRIDRLVYDAGPYPAAALTAVSTIALGGSITLGFTAATGDQVLPWLSSRTYPIPVPTALGSLVVQPDLVLPALTVGADGRVYLGIPFPDVPLARGLELHLQGLVTGSTTALTNASSLTLL